MTSNDNHEKEKLAFISATAAAISPAQWMSLMLPSGQAKNWKTAGWCISRL